MKIAIVGYGFVGKAMKRMFPEAIVYDPFVSELKTTKQEVNACDVLLNGGFGYVVGQHIIGLLCGHEHKA